MWKANVLPLLQQHVAEQVDSMTSYMLLQHEAAVANLLEVMPSKLLCCLMLKQLLYDQYFSPDHCPYYQGTFHKYAQMQTYSFYSCQRTCC